MYTSLLRQAGFTQALDEETQHFGILNRKEPPRIPQSYIPYWWGIILVMVMDVGMITPPIGMNVFVI